MNGKTNGNELFKASGYGPAGGSLPGNQKALRHGLNPLKRTLYTLEFCRAGRGSSRQAAALE